MKIKSTAQLFGVGLGTALGSLALMSAPAFSATLINEGSDEDAFLQKICIKAELSDCSDNTVIKDTLKIAEIQGKSARGNNIDSLFLGAKGSNTIPSNLLDDDILNWVNGTTYHWTLGWTPTGTSNGTAIFSVFSDSDRTSENKLAELENDYEGDFNTFNALGLLTRADDGFDATMELTLDFISFSNGDEQNTNISLSSSSAPFPASFSKKFFILDDDSLDAGVNMTELQGTFAMSWEGDTERPTKNGNKANSEVLFSISMFDPPGTSSVTTPEPTTILGLLGVGTLGLVGRKRKMEAK